MATSPPGPRARVVQAAAEGDQAAREGKPPTACPYSYDRAPLRRQAWTLGYGRARRLLDPEATPSRRDEATEPDEAWPGAAQ